MQRLEIQLFMHTQKIVDISIVSLINCIGGVMISTLTSGAVDCEFEPRSGKTKDYKIGICCFFAKHAALRRKIRDWSVLNQNNVFRVERHVYPQTVVSLS